MQEMQGAQVLILHDADVKGYHKKPLSQLQFLYWGAHSKVAPDAQIPFLMERLHKLEMAILCAPKTEFTIKVWPRVDAFSSLSRINQGKPKNNPC
jgi:hypothetical protein